MSYIGTFATAGGWVPGMVTIQTDAGTLTPATGALEIHGIAPIVTTKVSEQRFDISFTGFVPALNWNVCLVDTLMAVNNGYIPNVAAPLTFTLPAIAPVGSRLSVTGNYNSQLDVNRWTIAQNAGQTILREDVTTIAGVGHGIRGTTGWIATANVELVCVIANTGWMVIKQTNGGVEAF